MNHLNYLDYLKRGIVIFIFLLGFATSIPPLFSSGVIATTTFGNASVQNDRGLPVTQISFSIWGACIEGTCLPNGTNVTLTGNNTSATIQTPGILAFHWAPVISTFFWCTGMVYRGWSTREIGKDLWILMVLIVVLCVTVVAFIFDIRFFMYIQDKMPRFGGGVETKVGPGLWLTLGSLVCVTIIFFRELGFWVRNKYSAQLSAGWRNFEMKALGRQKMRPKTTGL